METYQLILVGLAGCVGISMVWDKIQGIPSKFKKSDQDNMETKIKISYKPQYLDSNYSDESDYLMSVGADDVWGVA